MSAPIIECPICMDAIDASKNSVVTDCGHTFHCSCLMQNAAHNGFGCPYCRSTMANEPQEEDEEDEEDDMFSQANQEIGNNALTSFRMFMQRLDGEEPEEEDEDDWETDEDEDEDEEEEPSAPNAAYMAAKLTERGVTYEDLVKSILFGEHSHFNSSYEDYDRPSAEIFGQFRAVMSRYSRERDVPAIAPLVVPAPQPLENNSPNNIIQIAGRLIHIEQDVAEPKTVGIPRRREFMSHV